nr:MAG TPA: hypothetical protein [Caudoviricetes sp.]
MLPFFFALVFLQMQRYENLEIWRSGDLEI